jgi:predicted acyltransferase (DUF342 family)
MTDEILSSITSDKVETDNTNFATLQADQTCEEVLIPRDNPVRQLNWQVTLEKGSVYNPQENVGIYAKEVECKYGVQVDGTVFGRDSVSVEHGGARHSAVENEEGGTSTIGARILGSLISEGSTDIVEPDAKLDDWEARPVTVYGDLIGGHVSIERPVIVYGSVVAEQMLWVDAPAVVLGDVRSNGSIEATDLFAFSITARDDLTLGRNVVTVNPTIWSEEGTVTFADDVGILDSETLATVQEEHELDGVSLGPWLFDEEAVWEGSRLVDADITPRGDGELANRAWRTVAEPAAEYEYIRSFLDGQVENHRRDPPDIDQFQYAGLTSVEESSAGGATGVSIEHDGDGDIVVGSQNKQIEKEDLTKIDNSTTDVTEETDIHDERTTIEDSVVNRSEIGSGETSSDENGEKADLDDESSFEFAED